MDNEMAKRSHNSEAGSRQRECGASLSKETAGCTAIKESERGRSVEKKTEGEMRCEGEQMAWWWWWEESLGEA